MYSFPQSASLFSLCPPSFRHRESCVELNKGLPWATVRPGLLAEPSAVQSVAWRAA